jgi:preprotein translocase subunit SecF
MVAHKYISGMSKSKSFLIHVSFTFVLLAGFLFSQKVHAQQSGGTVAQAQKTIEKNRKKRAKELAKADKKAKKRFLSMQSKETQKRMKQQQKELKKRANTQKQEKARKRRLS